MDGMDPRQLLQREGFRGLPPEVAGLTAVAFTVALGYGIAAPPDGRRPAAASSPAAPPDPAAPRPTWPYSLPSGSRY